LVVTAEHIAALRLDGGHLALDFVNTLGGAPHDPEPPPEWEALHRYADLLAWCVRVDVLTEEEADRLSTVGGGEAALREIIEVREVCWPLLWAVAEGKAPATELLAELTRRERQAVAAAHLTRDGGGFRWRWVFDPDPLSPLHPLVHAVTSLLLEGPLDRLRMCAGCRWLFLDESKNQSRRWCAMETCGAHHKKERYVKRRRQRRAATAP
jgi:predicted RNA-binding Zn ribbon-like protein